MIHLFSRLQQVKPVSWGLCFPVSLISTLGFAQMVVPLDPPTVRIEILKFNQAKIEDFSGLSVESACEAFAKHLINNSGPLGTGAFKAYRCGPLANVETAGEGTVENTTGQGQNDEAVAVDASQKQQVAETKVDEQKKNPTDAKKATQKPSTEWVLRISKQSANIRFEMMFPNRKTAMILLNIQKSEDPLSLIADPKLGPIIAHHLATALPIRSSITGEKLVKGGKIGGNSGGVPLTNLPKDFSLFELFVSKDSFLPRTVGSAQLIAGPKVNDEVSWLINTVTGTIDPKKIYYIQQNSSRSKLLQESRLVIRRHAREIQNALLANQRTADVGIRLGLPFGSNLGPLSKAILIGLFGEFRSGPVKGLKVNYDLIPRKKVTNSEGSQDFEWSRFQLGYSFGKAISGPIINWIDVTPRLGITNLRTEFVPESEDDFSYYNFSQTRAPTLGVEFGAEKRDWYLLFRSWFYASYSFSFLPIDKSYRTLLLRAGLDVYKDVLEIGDGSLSVLGFGWLDSTRISRYGNAEEDEKTADGLEYQVMYVGGGLTYSW